MELLKNIEVSPFCRTVWVSQEAKETWSRVISQISRFIQGLEVLSVEAGHRPVAWQTVGQQQLVNETKRWAEMGLVSLTIKFVRAFNGFAHKHEEPIPGDPSTNACVIVARNMADCLAFKRAFEKGDNVVQGQLLGFPTCCCEFFRDVWCKGYYDPIWQAATNTQEVVKQDGGIRHHRIRLKGHPFSNAILRYVGLRVSFHIPCSFDCEDTIRVAKERFELGSSINPDLMVLAESLLRMPMSWDVLKGLAVVRTPIAYFITSSVPCKERHIVEVEGDFIPKEAKVGCVYPFNQVGVKN